MGLCLYLGKEKAFAETALYLTEMDRERYF